MEDHPDKAKPRRRRQLPMVVQVPVVLLVYLSVVYAWSLHIYPLGRDFQALSGQAPDLPWVTQRVLALLVDSFGADVLGYHLATLLGFYLCLLCLAWVVHRLHSAPPWLGVLTAAYFLANPVHSEAALNLTGIQDVLPALLALLSVGMLPCQARDRSRAGLFAAISVFAVAVALFPRNLFLAVLPALHHWIVLESEERSAGKTIALTFVTLLAGGAHWPGISLMSLNPVTMFAPLYFNFYPIGFLPETARRFHESLWLGWVAAAAVLFILRLVNRKVESRMFTFALLTMAASRLFQGGYPVEPVHLAGGGRLLVSNAFFSFAVALLFLSIMRNAKWRRSTMSFTTILGAVLFSMQVYYVFAWRHAGEVVKDFQERSTVAYAEEAGPLGLLPDFQFYRNAPVMFSEAISFDTPFSKAVPHETVLELQYAKPDELTVHIVMADAASVSVRVDGRPPLDVAPWPYTLSREGAVQQFGEVEATLDSSNTDGFSVTLRGPRLPQLLLAPRK